MKWSLLLILPTTDNLIFELKFHHHLALTTNTTAHYKTNLFHDVTILAAKTRDLHILLRILTYQYELIR